MQIELLEILRCPKTGQKLVTKDCQYVDNQIISGLLLSEDGKNQYVIRDY